MNNLKENINTAQVEKIDSLINDLYALRKKGLASKNGEWSIENLIFKEFRNKGYLDKLKSLKNEIMSNELSL